MGSFTPWGFHTRASLFISEGFSDEMVSAGICTRSSPMHEQSPSKVTVGM